MIAFGNLSIKELERRTGWTFSEEDQKWLESYRQDDANITAYSEKFHIFDIPFEIRASASIKTKLMTILNKYEKSKEPLRIGFVSETEKQKIAGEKKILEEKEEQARRNDPKSIWLVKWHMLVPVKASVNNRIHDLYYGCFINTYTTGLNNIPDSINGTAWIEKGDEGLRGRFTLHNPEKDNDASEHEDQNFVVGLGFYDLSGTYLNKSFNFERVDFSIREAIETFKNVNSYNHKEILHCKT